MYNEQLPQAEEVKYLGLHLDRRLIWHKHIFAKRKHLGITLYKMYWLLCRKSKLSISNKLLAYKVILRPIWTYEIQRNTGTLPRESPAHDNRCTMVRAEYDPRTRSSNQIS
jgi:hypothetical protein